MNRSERRAAAARVKAASGSAPADIAELMAQANEAYRARRLAQAEIICKQVLSRAPAHATCLNLLGVVYQTAGRHRPAIKLFAKAIAVDDLDAGFHYNIACSYQALAERTPATMHFRKAITLGMGGNKHVEEFVMENVVIRQCIARIVSQDPAVGNAVPFGADDLAAIASDVFLRCALQLTTLHGVMLELFLTKLRAALLRLAGANAFDAVQVDDSVIDLLSALAQQCFINEYVFAQTDEEAELRKSAPRAADGTAIARGRRLAAAARRGRSLFPAAFAARGKIPFDIALAGMHRRSAADASARAFGGSGRSSGHPGAHRHR